MSENEPLLRAQPCAYDVMPASVKSAVKVGTENGWNCTASFAIGPAPEALQSVVFRASRPGIRLMSRHECRQQDTSFRFSQGFIQQVGEHLGWPREVGWRELTAALRAKP